MDLQYDRGAVRFTDRFASFLGAWLRQARAEQVARGYSDDFPIEAYQAYMETWDTLLAIYAGAGWQLAWAHPDLEQERPAIAAAYFKGGYQPIL
jgi:hypothetical protein